MKFLCFRCNIVHVTATVFLGLAIAFGGFLIHNELDTTNSERHCSMASEAESNMEQFKAGNHSAFVVGYSGEVGKALVKDLNALKIFKRVVLIGRREIPLDVGPEFEQKIVDFDNIEGHKDLFKDVDVGFCTLGTTRGKAGKEGFIKIDRDYVVNTAKVAKSQGCKQFALCTSTGADQNSCMLYAKTKGEAEEGVKALSFDRTSIYRPGALLCKREESRPLEIVGNVVLKPVFYFFPTAISVPVETVARAMINQAVAPLAGSPETTTIGNKEIHQVSGLSAGCKK